ncbi:MAG TPA: DMT family transporter [Ferruginibacter sp.]|nr:DMT family transporter [Ferruginibacter sp.]
MPGIQKNSFLTGFIITFIGSILFSTKAIIVKLAFAHTPVDALTLLALRMFFAAPFYLLIAFFYSNRSANVRFTLRQWMYIIFLGLIGYYISSLCDFIGLQYVSAGLERLILFLYPTFAILLNAAIFRQRINKLQAWALVLTYTGIGIAYAGELAVIHATSDFFYGSLFIFLCAVTFAIYLVGSGKLIPMVGATKFTSYAMLAAATGVLTHYSIAGVKAIPMNGTLIGYAVLLAIVATVIPTFFISNGLKKIGSNNVAIISSIGPVSTILQAHYILGEKLLAAQVAGTVLVITGVLLTGWRGREV